MGSELNHKLHIFFFPFLANGHIIPTVHMAKLFASRGVKTTIVTTPQNHSLISKSIQTSLSLGHSINIITIQFPSLQVGLPQGCENVDQLPSLALFFAFFKASNMLQEPLEQLLLQHHPNCLIVDFFFPWAVDSAAKFGIPSIMFHGYGSFALCAHQCIKLYQPYKNVLSESDPFAIPTLPGNEIKMTRMMLPDYVKDNTVDTEIAKLMKASYESEARCFGVVVNSFYELDGVYADHYKKAFGRKAWLIGPLSLCSKEIKEKANRGKEASIDEQECLKWLDSKEPSSVVYVCFGSISNFPIPQLKEIAMGLEASGQNFIWVVKKNKKEDEDDGWLPEGFEKRMEGKGLIIRGWAPQVLILEHKAIGGFVTHCGWNSTLEAISAGVPMVTRPVFSDQFYNEKFVTQVIRIGVAVGVKKYVSVFGDNIDKEAIVKTVKDIMEGEEAEEMRNRAKKLGKMAREAVEEGGSSYLEVDSLIKELTSLKD